MIDENDRLAKVYPSAISHKEICARPWKGFYFPHPAWMGRTEWFRKYRYDVLDSFLCEDQELLLRSYAGSNFATVNEILFAYRIKSKIAYRKLSRVRVAFLRVQIAHFMNAHQWKYILMSMAAFVGRLLGDFIRLLIEILNPVIGKLHPAYQLKNFSDLERQWKSVLNKVSGEQIEMTISLPKIHGSWDSK